MVLNCQWIWFLSKSHIKPIQCQYWNEPQANMYRECWTSRLKKKKKLWVLTKGTVWFSLSSFCPALSIIHCMSEDCALRPSGRSGTPPQTMNLKTPPAVFDSSLRSDWLAQPESTPPNCWCCCPVTSGLYLSSAVARCRMRLGAGLKTTVGCCSPYGRSQWTANRRKSPLWIL